MKPTANGNSVTMIATLASLVFSLTVMGPAMGAGKAIPASQVESDIAWLINLERSQTGLPQLAQNAELSKVARLHSEEMRDEGYMAHESPVPGNKTPEDRYLNEFGVKPEQLAENVSKLDGIGLTSATAQSIHSAFMNSPGHRANVIRSGVSQMGIGVVTDGSGTVWTTELFAEPGSPSGDGAGTQETQTQPTSRTGASTAATAATALPAAARAVKVHISCPAPEPAATADGTQLNAWRFKFPATAGETVRWGITAAVELEDLRLQARAPGSKASRKIGGPRSIHEAPSEMIFTTGQYEVCALSGGSTPVRFIAVTGSRSAVELYGRLLRAPAPLTLDVPAVGSIGDGLSPEIWSFQVPTGAGAALDVHPLQSDSALACAVFGTTGQLVARGTTAGGLPWQLPLSGLQPGEHLLVISAPQARPSAGDYQVSLRSSSRQGAEQ